MAAHETTSQNVPENCVAFTQNGWNVMTRKEKEQLDFVQMKLRWGHHVSVQIKTTVSWSSCPFTSKPVYSFLINDKAEKPYVLSLLSEAIGALQLYLPGAPSRSVHSSPKKPSRLVTACQMGLWRGGVSTGRTVITFGLESSRRHNSAQL